LIRTANQSSVHQPLWPGKQISTGRLLRVRARMRAEKAMDAGWGGPVA